MEEQGETASPTWVCGRDDGPEEEAVGEEEISPELPDDLHEGHKPVHDQPGRRRRRLSSKAGSEEMKQGAEEGGVNGSDWHRRERSPDNEAGNDGSHEGVGQDGADVSEEMSLWREDRRCRGQNQPVHCLLAS